MDLPEVLHQVQDALIRREVGRGLQLLREAISHVSDDGQPHEHEALLVSCMAEWIDMDFSLFPRVQSLLEQKFPKSARATLSCRAAIGLRLADSIVKMHKGETNEAISDLTHVLSGEVEEKDWFILSNYFMARCHRRQGQIDDALNFVAQARKLASDAGREKQAAVIELLQAWLMFQKGNYHDHGAIEVFNRAAAQIELTDDFISKGNVHSFRARIARRLGDESTALERFSKAIETYKERDRKLIHPSLARALANMASVQLSRAKELEDETEQKDRLERLQTTRAATYERLESFLRSSWKQETVKLIEQQMKDKQSDARDRKISAELHALLGNSPMSAKLLDFLSRAVLNSGFLEQKGEQNIKEQRHDRREKKKEIVELRNAARSALKDAEAIYNRLQDHRGLGLCSLRRAVLCQADGQYPDGVAAAQEAYEFGERDGNKRFMGRARVLQCRIKNQMFLEGYNDPGQHALEAAGYGREAVACAQESQDLELQGKAFIANTYALMSINDHAGAWESYWKAKTFVARAHLGFLWRDLGALLERLASQDVLRAELGEWILKLEGKTWKQLKEIVFRLVWDRYKDRERVAAVLGISLKTLDRQLRGGRPAHIAKGGANQVEVLGSAKVTSTSTPVPESKRPSTRAS